MQIGTKSVLFGAHCFFLHPWFVALGWWKLYGFPWDPRLWIAFFVHDLGYIGKPNMDGPEGIEHPLWGARFMTRWFDEYVSADIQLDLPALGYWGYLCLLHSRTYAEKYRWEPSKLCVADKLGFALTPWWLYLPMVLATGEIHEYMADSKQRGRVFTSYRHWFDVAKRGNERWITEWLNRVA